MTETKGKDTKIKRRITEAEAWLYKLVDEENKESKISRIFNQFIMILIVLSVFAVALETVDTIKNDPNFKVILGAFEYFTVVIFTFEYFVRLFTAHIFYKDDPNIKTKGQAMWKYAISFYGLVDLITIMPFYMPWFNVDARIFRMLRLLRFMRLFKIARYNNSLTLIKDVMLDKRPEISVSCFVIIIVMVIASFIMYNVEHDAQPEQFPNVFSCIWWAVVTLTTVGYGDVYPITLGGKIVGGTIAFLGIGLVALPTGIISAGFLERITKQPVKKDSDNDSDNDSDSDNLRHNVSDGDDSINSISDGDNSINKIKGKKFCPYCGEKIEYDTKKRYCPYCGELIK